jgi:hypothetical protein
METTRPSSGKLSSQRGILSLLMRMSELLMKTLTLILKVMGFSKNNLDCENLWRLVVLDKQHRHDITRRTPIVLEKQIKRLFQLANVVTRLASF